MRILFVSNYYPPYSRGGYEQWCEEVACLLAARGHTLAILTSRPPVDASNRTGLAVQEQCGQTISVHRLLHSQVQGGLGDTAMRLLAGHKRVEAENIQHTRNLLESFQPDVVLIWGMWNIDRAVPQQVEAQAGPHVAYYLCDYWPALPSAYEQRLHEPARRAHLQQFKTLLRQFLQPRLDQGDAPGLHLDHPICVSRAVRTILVERGVAVQHARIVYGGTQVEEFAVAPQVAPPGAPLQLLYIGRLERLKGVHTLIEAMQLLQDKACATLDLLGAGDQDYVAELHAMVEKAHLQDRVHFLGAVQRVDVPAVLATHDVLVFPSEWEEPFARSILEAMAAGLVVVGTTTGGTGEILYEEETGLTFPAGHAEHLAAQIRRLAGDPALRRRLSETGRRIVRQQYTLGRMVDELEAELTAIADPAALSN